MAVEIEVCLQKKKLWDNVSGAVDQILNNLQSLLPKDDLNLDDADYCICDFARKQLEPWRSKHWGAGVLPRNRSSENRGVK